MSSFSSFSYGSINLTNSPLLPTSVWDKISKDAFVFKYILGSHLKKDLYCIICIKKLKIYLVMCELVLSVVKKKLWRHASWAFTGTTGVWSFYPLPPADGPVLPQQESDLSSCPHGASFLPPQGLAVASKSVLNQTIKHLTGQVRLTFVLQNYSWL